MSHLTMLGLAHVSTFLCLCLVHVQAAAPIVGSAGGAVLFDKRRADIISGRWVDTPKTTEMTLEFWYRMTDPYVLDGATFAYGAFDSSLVPGVEHPEELLVWVQQNGVYAWKNESYVSCDTGTFPQNINASSCGGNGYLYGQWKHYTFVFSGVGKNVTIYLDGRPTGYKMGGNAVPLISAPLLPDGIFSFGQDQDVLGGGFDQTQSLPAVIDEVRVWDYARTKAEVAATWDTTVPSNSPGLNLYWRFDEWDAYTEPDMSGHGNHALMGHLAGAAQEMAYVTPQPPRKPTSPIYVPSDAPIKAGHGPRYTNINATGQPTRVVLQAYDADGDVLACRITSLPTNGTLQSSTGVVYTLNSLVTEVDTSRSYPFAQQSYVVYYVPSADLVTRMQSASTIGKPQDSFQYSVTDSSSTTVSGSIVMVRDRNFQPVSQELTLIQNTWIQFSLGGYDEYGNGLTAIITKLPTNGTLYIPQFTGSITARQKILPTVVPGAKWTRVTVAQPIARIAFGQLIYVPNKNQFSVNSNTPLDVIEFKWITAVTDDAPKMDIYANDHAWPLETRHIKSTSTGSATVSFYVTYVNSAPAPAAQSINLNSTRSMVNTSGASVDATQIQLTSFDVDAALGYNAHPYYYISSFPTMGTLYQYPSTSGSTLQLDEPVNFELHQAVTFDWVLRVRNVTDSFGSSGSRGRDTDICDGWFGCTQYWNAWGLLGAPNAYPVYGDSQFTYSPRLADEGLIFLDLEFAHSMYVQGLEIYEVLNPGTIVKVQIPNDGIYKGYNTTWTDIWRGQSQILPQKVHVTTPQTCPEPVATKVVRVWMDTNIPGWNELDAVKMFGTFNIPSGLVSDDAGRIVYVPNPGTHTTSLADLTSAGVNITGLAIPTFDKFSYYATDCQANSAPTTVTITRQAPDVVAQPAQTLSQFQTIQIAVTQDVTTNVDLSTTIIPTLIKTAKAPTNTQQVAISVRATPGMDKATSIKFASGTADVQPLQWSNAKVLSITPSAAQGTFDSFLWISVQGYTYRVQLHFVMNCTGRSWSRDVDGACVPCQEISSDQVNRMSAADSYQFMSICKTDYSPSLSSRMVLVVIAAVGIVFAIFVAIALIIFRQAKAIKASSIMFMVMIMAGVAGLLGTIFTLYPSENAAACIAQVWLGHISFSMLFGSLLLKTYRLAHIFNNRKFHVRALSDGLLFKYLCTYVAVVCAILIAWMVVSAPTIVTRLQERTEYHECGSDKSVFKWILIGLHAALLAWGVYLCVISRKVYSELNESKYIAVCIYNVALIAVVLVAIDNAAKPTPDALYFITAVGILLGCLVTMGLIAGPKIYYIYSRRHSDLGMGDVTVNASRLSNDGEGAKSASAGRSSGSHNGDSGAVANSADWLKFGLFVKKMQSAIDAHRLDQFVNTHRGLQMFLAQIKNAVRVGNENNKSDRDLGNSNGLLSELPSSLPSSSPGTRKQSQAPILGLPLRKTSLPRGSASSIETGHGIMVHDQRTSIQTAHSANSSPLASPVMHGQVGIEMTSAQTPSMAGFRPSFSTRPLTEGVETRQVELHLPGSGATQMDSESSEAPRHTKNYI